MLRRLASLVTASALALAGLPATGAAAATGMCRQATGSPRCQVWTGKVAWVPDGDTLLVDVNGDGTKTPVSIRLIGVQAMEQHVYSPQPAKRRGECHSLEATARVESMVRAGRGVVRMTAINSGSSSRNRPLRSVSVKINGTWQDIGLDLVRNGYALWLPFGGEWAWDSTYELASAYASHEGKRLFDTDSCGSGPSQAAKLTVWANSDADGDDDLNLNGEWIRIGNPTAADVPVGGWWVRDSGLRRYTFARGTVIPAGGAVYVHVGSGTDTVTDKYWGLTSPIFTNVDPGRHVVGDGAYLFDPQGDLRGWMMYPCRVACTSPLKGKVSLRVRYTYPERIELVNTGAEPVDLQGHVVFGRPYLQRYLSTDILRPGEAREVRLGPGRQFMDDAGGSVELQTADMWTVDRVSWGTG
ncbi:lamin tail domain-containing protein [Actinoplanes sp. NPDC051851]|uniref:lamin tail domain-containing protein n=1 Tax=Actinoplanes sp. NPDC051851 TaxID=3154753 RepID=UPI003416B879